MGLHSFIKLIFNRKDKNIEKNKYIENIYKDKGDKWEKTDLVEVKSESDFKDKENNSIQEINVGEVSDCKKIDIVEAESELNLKYVQEENDSIIQDIKEQKVSSCEKIDLVEVESELNLNYVSENNDRIQDINEGEVIGGEKTDLGESIVNTNAIGEFIDVYDIEKIYFEGTYKVGVDIPVGEYYFWGQQVWALDRRGFQINSDDELADFYLKLKKGRVITVEGGKFTMVENIKYKYNEENKIVPNHMYRIEEEIPKGIYSFWYDENMLEETEPNVEKECVIEIYADYPYTKRVVEHASTGKVCIDSNCKYLKIANGFAKLEKKDNVISNLTRRLEYEEFYKINSKIQEEKYKNNNVFENNRMYFYAYIEDVETEVLINNFYECEKVTNPYKNDKSLNYKFSVSDNNIDEIRFINYLFYIGKLQIPVIYDIPINKFYMYVKNQKFWSNDNEIRDIKEKLNLTDFNSFWHFLEYVTKVYPARLLLDNNPMENYEFYQHGKYINAYFNREECENLYKKRILELAERGLINKRWKSEFSLYILVKEYYEDTIYQYRSEWLEQQSLDIFIPSINVAIEYQGRQHYEAIDIFGGRDGLENRKRLDEEKRKKCLDNNVKLIEWRFDLLINDKNLKRHLEKIGINIPIKKEYDYTYVYNTKGKKEDSKKEKTVIYQYNLKGEFVNEFENIKMACDSIKSKGVGKVINGLQNTAGGFYWKRVIAGYPKTSIKIEQNQVEGMNIPKSVVQMNDKGDIIMIFKSIKEASKAVGVGEKSIRFAASGKQKHAGGYCWKFVDSKNN